MPAPSEFELQRAFTYWLKGLKNRDGTWKIVPAIRPGVVAWHTPNGGERRDAFEGKRLKESGVEAGIPDYLFLSPHQFPDGRVFGLLFGIEFKKPGRYKSPEDGLSAAQRTMQPAMLAAGMVACATVDNLDDAKKFCLAHGLAVDSLASGG